MWFGGTVYSFGHNVYHRLGLGHSQNISVPTPIPNIPQIKTISCGGHFTVCIDMEGFMWTFGNNSYGQLGTGNKTSNKVHKK